MKRKATKEDLFNSLSSLHYKTGLELLKELEGRDLRIGYMRGALYYTLRNWGEQGIVESRFRSIEDSPQKEYRKIGSLKSKEKEVERTGGLESSLVPA